MKTFLNRNENELHFMVDIETLSLSPRAAITEIGAVVMNPWHASNTSFHQQCFDPYGEKDRVTMDWRKEHNLPWITEKSVTIDIENSSYWFPTVIESFFTWIRRVSIHAGREPVMWCKGTDFDCVILRVAVEHRAEGAVTPWKYNKFHDMRTLQAVFPQFAVDKSKLKHNGLDDARMQATALINIAEYIARLEDTMRERDFHFETSPIYNPLDPNAPSNHG